MFGLRTKNTSQIKEIREVVKFLHAHLAQMHEKRESIDKDLFEVTDFLLSELIDIYQSIATLYTKDHFRSCLVLARSVFENSINLQYLYKEDTDRRAKNYRLFSIREYLSRADKFECDEVQKSEIVVRLRKEIEEYAPSGKHQRYWDGKSLREEAVEISCEQTYENFKQCSNYIHSKFRVYKDFSARRPYLDFLRDIVSRRTVYATLSALAAVAVKLDLEGGVMIIDNYPSKSPDIFFATNPKKVKMNDNS